jgi:hypothetical protein
MRKWKDGVAEYWGELLFLCQYSNTPLLHQSIFGR